jgi:hypothetical protein
MKIKHKKYFNRKLIDEMEFPAVVWWVDKREFGNVTLFHTVTSDTVVKETLDAIQKRDSFIKWLGWETIESFNEHENFEI